MKEKKKSAHFPVTPPAMKPMATGHRYLVKTEKTLNLQMADNEQKTGLADGNRLHINLL